jgi:hypothetical protein
MSLGCQTWPTFRTGDFFNSFQPQPKAFHTLNAHLAAIAERIVV